MLAVAASARAQFIWIGQGTTRSISDTANWGGFVAPPNDGSADLYFPNGLHDKATLPANYDVDGIFVGGGNDFTIDASTPTTLHVGSGIALIDNQNNFLRFGPNVTVDFAGTVVFDVKDGTMLFAGHITGGATLDLIQSDASGNGTFIFNNTGTGNTYSGATYLGDGNGSVGVAFWNSTPFGSSSVYTLVPNGGLVTLIAHGTQTLTNNFNFTFMNPGSGQVTFRSWDAPLRFNGQITLGTNALFAASILQNALPAPNGAGSIPIPGASQRNPIMFQAAGITQMTAGLSLTLNGPGIFILNGNNTYSGGTIVGGNIIFGSNASIPSSGSLTINGGGYVGFADNTAGQFAAFLSGHVPVGAAGGIGFDTLPGSSTATFNDAINLTGYTNLRLGSATTAIITGTITPANGTADYKFGNGGGILQVQSALSGTHNVSLSSTNGTVPLTVYLQGYNTYSGTTNVGNGFLIFDSANAFSILSPANSLTAGGAATAVGSSYIGYTVNSGFTPSTFLGNFNKTSTWGIVGFDTGGTTLSNVDLTGFNDGVFIGTTTAATLDASTFTGTNVTNGSNAANTLRFTAAQSGILTVNGTIADGAFPKSVMIGTPAISGPYSSGTVILNGANTYTGGTTVNAGNIGSPTLAVGNSAALGTGTLTFTSGSGGIAGLQATSGGINLANAINLFNSAPGTGSGPQLYLTGTQSFTLSGSITGDQTTTIYLYNASPLSVTLAGNNAAFLGTIQLFNGSLTLLNNYGAGSSTINFGLSGAGTLTFGGAATAPLIYGLTGDSGTVSIPGGTNLTYDLSYGDSRDTDFGGIISGSGSLTLTAPTSSHMQGTFLSGANTYSGGTTVLDHAVLAMGNNSAAGSGTVTLNAPYGGIALNSGVTFTNPLTYTTGALMGFGTYAPTGSPTLTFDTGHTIAPGLAGVDGNEGGVVGTLTLNTDVVFANGGQFNYGLKDPGTADGLSLLNISGNLNITASAGGFTLKLFTYDTSNNLGFANLTLGNTYNLPIATVTGTLNGFSASAFTVDATNFQLGQWSPTVFTVSQTGNTLYLNFTAVPEPSTYALLALGLGTLVAPALRLRRRR